MTELDMTVIVDLEETRRKEHRCISCGTALTKTEIHGRCIRCAECRKTYTDRTRERRIARIRQEIALAEADAQKQKMICPTCGRTKEDENMALCLRCERDRRAKQIKAEKERAERAMSAYNRQAEKCRACYWSSLHDGHIFCPAPVGTCMKADFRAMWQEAKEKRKAMKGENNG